MRNPLKKLQKKINFRLANNAAQHSQSSIRKKAASSSPSPTRRFDHSTTSVTSQEPNNIGNEDPLFNNRSSKLRLAVSESKKSINAQQEAAAASSSASTTNATPNPTPKKKKKGRSKLSFGTSRKTQSIGSVPDNHRRDDKEEEEKVTRRSKSLSPQQAPQTPPKGASPTTESLTSSGSFDNALPTASSQRKSTKANSEKTTTMTITKTQPAKHKQQQQQQQQQKTPGNNKRTTTSASKTPKLRDPNLERIAKAAAALDNTGNALFEKGEYDKAMANYVKALKLKNRTLAGAQQFDANDPVAAPKMPPEKPAGSNNNHNKGAPSDKNNSSNTSSAAATSTDVPAKEGAAADDLWISVATSINNIGYLRQQSGQASAEETMQAYQNSLQIKRRVLGKDNLSVGKTLNNLGTVHYLKREYEQALNAYREALQIMMATLGPHHLDVGTVHSNIGDVYWAQSGDVKVSTDITANSNNNNSDASPQQSYQASRNSALQHYRKSLEIRWEQLKDHHDPKVIRLLEKIAALEMGESFLALVQNNHRHRQSPKGSNNGNSHTVAVDSIARSEADEALEAELGKPVEEELQTLHEEVRSDVKKMDMMERKMAIDMVKDKLRLVREMKKLSNMTYLYNSDDDEAEDDDNDDDLFSLSSEVRTPTKVKPLSPVQRTEALYAVKERLRQLRDSRSKEPEPMIRRFPISEVSDLKEADRSPSNFFLSHRASQLLNRLQPPSGPPKIDGLDELRRFSFNEPENDPEAGGLDGSQRPVVDVLRKAEHQLEEGIEALRSLSVNQDNIPKDGNPWVIASTLTTSPEKPMCSPQAPLSATSMAAY